MPKKMAALILVALLLCLSVPCASSGYGIQNGDFSEGSTGWNLNTSKGEVTADGTLRLFAKTSVGQEVDGIVAGNTYTVSFRHKADTGTSVLIDLEWWVPCGIDAYTILKTDYSYGTADGTWRTKTQSFTAPAYAEAVCIHLRKNDSTSGAVYFDDVALTGTYGETVKETVQPVTGGTAGLETDSTFYYSDRQGDGTATVSTGLDADTVQFSLWDSENAATAAKEETVTYGESFSFPLSLLSKEKHEYVVRAKVYKGTILVAEGERRVYKFPRSSRIASDGIYRIDNTPFMPVMMYNITNTAHYSKMAEIGVNVVQAQVNDTTLNAAQAQGLKVLGVLYTSMLPAGHPNNVNQTRYLVNKYKNHSALFGWAIMDEPDYNLTNKGIDETVVDGWLENSYKIIREIDDEHPVYLTQDASRRYSDAAHYTDILCIDPYVGTDDFNSFVYNRTQLAMAATKGDKPVYTLLQTCEFGGTFPTNAQARHMAYQTRLAGAQGIGYYCFEKAQGDLRLDQTDLWAGLKAMKDADLPLLPTLQPFRTRETDSAIIGAGDNYVVALNKTTAVTSISMETLYSYSEKLDGNATAKLENGVLTVTLQPSAAAVFSLGDIEVENMFIGDFRDESADDWVLTDGAEIADGILTISGTSTASYAQTVTSITPGHYILRFKHKNETNGGSGYCPNVLITAGSYSIDMTGWTSVPAPNSADWVEYTVYFKVPEGAQSVQIYFRGSTKGPYRFDDVVLERESKMHFSLLNDAGFNYNGAVYPTDSRIRRHPLTEGDRTYYPVKMVGKSAEAGKPLVGTVHVPDAKAGETVMLTAAVYTSDGTELIDVYVKNHTFIQNDDGFVTIDIEEAVQSGAKVKLFLWTDTLSGETESFTLS